MSYATFLNFYQTTLGAALSSTATSLTVSSTTGLPSSLASGQFIPMTLTPASSPGSAYEIVYVTGISGSTLTVERGEENTSALTWNTGDILYSTNTAGTTAPLEGPNFTGPVTSAGLITANGGIDLAIGTPVTGIPYDIVSGVSGPITSSQYVLAIVPPRNVNIPANFGGSQAKVLGSTFTNAASFSIYNGGTLIGTLSFSAGASSGSFSTASAFTILAGSEFYIIAPSTADPSAANLTITIMATLA